MRPHPTALSNFFHPPDVTQLVRLQLMAIAGFRRSVAFGLALMLVAGVAHAKSASPTGDASAVVNINGNPTKGTGAIYKFDLEETGYFNDVTPTVRNLTDFDRSTAFSAGDFSYENRPGNIAGNFVLNTNSPQFLPPPIPEPAAWPLVAGVAILGFVLLRRRDQDIP